MNVLKALWRLGLCTLFVIGFSYGFSANASEPAASEKALHEAQGSHEETKPEMLEMKGEAEEEAQEMKGEAEEEASQTQQDVQQKMHETEGE
jgi:hypothetical protein